jgi:hypothetical protein
LKVRTFLPIFSRLKEAGVQYVVVGGLANVLHGYARLTADIDLCLNLDSDNLRRALDALGGLGFVPRSPVNLYDFADSALRQAWIQEKGMVVFSLVNRSGLPIEVDLFSENPIPFEDLYRDRLVRDVAGVEISVVSRAHLIELKRLSGRPQDLADIQVLEALDE